MFPFEHLQSPPNAVLMMDSVTVTLLPHLPPLRRVLEPADLEVHQVHLLPSSSQPSIITSSAATVLIVH